MFSFHLYFRVSGISFKKQVYNHLCKRLLLFHIYFHLITLNQETFLLIFASNKL
ncbi:hypothetical protein BACSTE_00970 [Bacteroides stercoris ATCC 43183]|uniref:Uncharacterized protein n=1 Tax=Bacteroides stercoris ATCC 43183 TaxID=449673 RepID=B0NNG5_BACSE|nr:hypothetical protein BACSTE_00970 [Bacteroides stercoris ATCC 43183]